MIAARSVPGICFVCHPELPEVPATGNAQHAWARLGMRGTRKAQAREMKEDRLLAGRFG